MNGRAPGEHPPPTGAQVATWTTVALIAFAGNSLLCRAALVSQDEGPALGPVGFTAVRLLAGALALLPFALRNRGDNAPRPRPWAGATALLAYGICFSVSYVTVPAGVGALLLFGTVQITMIATARLRGEAMTPTKLLGLLAAAAGVVVLVGVPSGDERLDPTGAALMVVAGVGWAVYTLLGRGDRTPTRSNGLNFLKAAPAAAALLGYALFQESRWTTEGVLLAVCSGAVTSGAGYAIWYAALRGHSRTSAAAVQLTVPLIASVGGVLLLGESATTTLALSAALILGGVGLTLRPSAR